MKATSLGGGKYWLLTVDQKTKMKWTWILKNKSELKDKFLTFIKDLRSKHKIEIKKMRCDNAGKNKAFIKACKKGGVGIHFKEMAPGTPQQNGLVKRSFATLYGQVRSMLNMVGVTKKKRKQLWAECASTATKVENIMTNALSKPTAYEAFYGAKASNAKHL